MSARLHSSVIAVSTQKTTRVRRVRYLWRSLRKVCAKAPAMRALMNMAPPNTGSMPNALENRLEYMYW